MLSFAEDWPYTLATIMVGISRPPMGASMDSLPRRSSTGPEQELSSSLYIELHRLAAAKMRHERGNHTLQPTALVNEAYMRLAVQAESVWGDRARCLGTAAKVMRNVLIDHARVHRAEKRGGGAVQVTLDDALLPSTKSLVDVLAIDDALNQLARFDARQAEILELHFFGGLTFEEIASHLSVSTRTVKRDWTMARAWLKKELSSKQ